MKIPVRVALAGAGVWGANLLRNLASNPHVELRAVCDPRAEIREEGRRRYGGVTWLETLEEALADDELEALVIATPSSLHHQHALAALRAGKHVLVEKPMATTVSGATELVEVARRGKLTLMVGHVFLHNNLVQDVARRIQAGDLGRIRYAYSQRLNLGRFRHDSDVLWTLAPHDVSILGLWFQDRPIRVSVHGLAHLWDKERIPDVCFGLLEYPGDRAAHLHLSWLDPQKVRRMVVVGDEKMLIYDDMDSSRHLQVYDKGLDPPPPFADYSTFKTSVRAGDLVIPSIRMQEPLRAEINQFVRCVRTGQRPSTCGLHGLEVTCVLAAMSRSLRASGQAVEVDYPAILDEATA